MAIREVSGQTAMEESAKIRVVVWKSGDGLILCVGDGCGLGSAGSSALACTGG